MQSSQIQLPFFFFLPDFFDTGAVFYVGLVVTEPSLTVFLLWFSACILFE